jgi:hypothetical protein
MGNLVRFFIIRNVSTEITAIDRDVLAMEAPPKVGQRTSMLVLVSYIFCRHLAVQLHRVRCGNIA